MEPRYKAIKSALMAAITKGQIKSGQMVESENALANRFNVSRMTARRALTELVDEGILGRSQGLGTFVSDHRPMSSILTIRGIDEEILARGHSHSASVLIIEERQASEEIASWLGVETGRAVYYSEVVHYENDIAIQLEQRYVNPLWAPEYLSQDFTHITPNHYLSSVAPLTQADHSIDAIGATGDIAKQLDVEMHSPCLRIHRRTYCEQGIVSFAVLFHPGSRYRLGGHLDFKQD